MARIALGSNVKEGPRRGKVVGHRPKGMVDVQFEDVEWVERRQESNLRRGNPYPDTKKPSKEQFRRQQMAIYQSQKDRGFSDGEAWSSSFAIATGVGQKHGWLKPGTQEPTAKGRRGSKQKLKTSDAWAKEQQYELGLGRHRKSGKFRVAPTRHGSQLRYYVQPGGQYFHGKGAKKRAEALRDDLNGVSMPKRLAMAANPKTKKGDVAWLEYTLHMDEAEMTGLAFEDIGSNKMKVYETYNLPEYMEMFSKPKIMTKAKARECWSRLIPQDDGYGNRVWVPRRQNWLPAVAAALTVADVGYRAVRDRKKKKKEKKKENPRYLDERGGMKRGIADLRREARKPTGLEHKSMAELAAQRKALLARKAKRANPSGNGPITRKADLKRDEQYTIWLKMVSGTFVVERSYPGSYIQDAMWTDIKAYNRQNKRQYVVVEQGIDPNTGYRQNFVGAAIRGGVALIKTPLGKKIAAEVTAIASVLIVEKVTSKAQKLVSDGKIDPQVLAYVQRRIEQKTGKKPSKAKVSEVLAAMDPNKDKTLTATEVVKGFGKTKTNRRR